MSDPRDDLRNFWRDGWRELESPPLEPGDDAPTRAAVDWMRAAWRELEAPATHLSAPRVPRRVPRLVSALVGAAAAWLALLGLWALGSGPRPQPPNQAEQHEPRPVHASIRRDGTAELRAGAVTLVLLDESASPELEMTQPGEK